MTRRTRIDAALPARDADGESRAGCGAIMGGAYLLGLVLLAAALGWVLLRSSMEVDARGVTIPAVVLGKHERLQVRYDSWSLDRQVTVRYRPSAPSRSWLRTAYVSVPDEATFDRLRAGGPVRIRYLPRSETASLLGLPSVRLAERSTLDDLRLTALPVLWQVLEIAALVLLAFGFLLLWVKARSRVAALGALLTAIVAWVPLEAPELPPAPSGAVGHATAVVRDVYRITRMGEGDETAGVELVAPYRLVSLAIVPERAGDTVLAVDAVDDGVPGIATGTRLAVTYERARPRVARIDDATRTFVRRNLVWIWIVGPATLVVVIAMFALVRALFGRLRRAGERRLAARRGARSISRG
ncbi:MAG TPA: hypothetical protein VFS44_01770 [Gemmatimonadaceae bacterium]|nr:hypothetical protein [Gemmatimonadaceae bacterium]